MNTSNTRTAILMNKTICIQFPYDMQIIQAVRDIPGRDWNGTARQWELPSTPWHMSKVIETLKPFNFYIDPTIIKNANGKAPAPKLRLPDNLYDYQKEGVKFIYKTGGRCIVADDMGLGKTAEALVFTDQFCGKTLVIAPANVLFKWALKEVPMWTNGKTVQVILTGKQVIEDRDITVMSYGIMVSKYDELNAMPFDCMIFDESHYLKSPKTQRTRVAKALVKGVPHILFLSGTPFMNRPSELYTSLNMIDPRGFNNFYHYAARYCGFEYIGGHWLRPEREIVTHADELAARLGGVMLRRTKRQVAIELPDLTRVTIPVTIDNVSEYRKAIADFRQKRRDNPTKNPANVLVQLSQLRQVVGQGKVTAALELAESILQNGEQVVLYCHHQSVVHELAEGLKSYGVGVIDGNTSARARQEISVRFLGSNATLKQSEKLRVIVMSSAGAEGLDLYSSSHIIFCERNWTPAREEQAEARLHRMGQKQNVTAYYIVATSTVDEKMNDVVEEKRKIFGQVIHQDEIVNSIMEYIEEVNG